MIDVDTLEQIIADFEGHVHSTEFAKELIKHIEKSLPMPESGNYEHLGKYVTEFATREGWKAGHGEGAFEYIQRISYRQGMDDEEERTSLIKAELLSALKSAEAFIKKTSGGGETDFRKKLQDVISVADNTTPAPVSSEVLDMLKKYRVAASRMCDRWAEGDQAVKDELWRTLHSLEVDALDIIAKAEKGTI